MTTGTVASLGRRIASNVGQVIIGKQLVTEFLMIALLCERHVLIEDVPGVGKTSLARAIARSIDGTIRRIQFTPDLLPSDVSGISYFNQKLGEFEFRSGPVFANIVLADEINRATPRTQAALLEAMEERTVTVDGDVRNLPRPFLVLATQNPVELEGTFPLPEAQLDRFLMRVTIGYPDEDQEVEFLTRHQKETPLTGLGPVTTLDELKQAAEICRSIYVDEEVRRYLARITRATRDHNAIELGVSPRGTLALFLASQARAALHDRDYVIPDDVKFLAPAILEHRLMLDPDTRLRGRTAAMILSEIIETVPVPVEEL